MTDPTGNATNAVLVGLDTARARTVSSAGMDIDGDSTAGADIDGEAFPELLRLAGDGTVARNAFATAPWTLPSHASLFTGVHSSKHGAHAGHKRLDDAYPTLAESFAAAGYETVGVSNNTWVSEEFGLARGFETFFKTWQYVQSDTDLGRIARQEEGLDKLTEATKAIFDGNPITDLTNAIYFQFFRKTEDDGAARTNEWIEDWLTARNDSRPFFLFVNYLEPLLKCQPPEEHAKEYPPEGVTYEEAMEISQDVWGYIADKVKLTDDDFEILRALYRAEITYLKEKIVKSSAHSKPKASRKTHYSSLRAITARTSAITV